MNIDVVWDVKPQNKQIKRRKSLLYPKQIIGNLKISKYAAIDEVTDLSIDILLGKLMNSTTVLTK